MLHAYGGAYTDAPITHPHVKAMTAVYQGTKNRVHASEIITVVFMTRKCHKCLFKMIRIQLSLKFNLFSSILLFPAWINLESCFFNAVIK